MKINPNDLDDWRDKTEDFERIKKKKVVWEKKTEKKRNKDFKKHN